MEKTHTKQIVVNLISAFLALTSSHLKSGIMDHLTPEKQASPL